MTKRASIGPASGREWESPLYRRMAREIKQDIVSGKYPVGSLLPTEQELCGRFGSSRYTVREALRLLGEDGMVERRQGRGSEVISDVERPVYAQSLTSLSELYDYAADTRLVLDHIERIVPDADLAVQLGRKPGREWLMAKGIRTTSEGAVICVSHVFVHQDFDSIAPQLKSHTGAIHRLIEEQFGVPIYEVHQEITTVRLVEDIAVLLGERSDDNAILVTRRYLDADSRPIIVSLNWHRLGGFTYSQIIRRE
ncbi:GntR family transcriptional regulator [Hoeflea sp.]|uniref:GntR family transcriptional regulator n=1 Tax=Hoeflea sp. TaxID=1940281 RepID=UPI003B028A50